MLKALAGIILKGPDVIEWSADRSLQDQAILTISQLFDIQQQEDSKYSNIATPQHRQGDTSVRAFWDQKERSS